MENNKNISPSRSELITDFVKTNPNYYIEQFQKIGSKPTFSYSFNLYAQSIDYIITGIDRLLTRLPIVSVKKDNVEDLKRAS